MSWPLVTFRGVGQIMFQGHALTGLLFTVGIAAGDFVNGPIEVWMAVAGVLGSLIGAGISWLLNVDHREWADGIYGYNPALVGMATFFFFKPTVTAVGLFAAFAVASTLLTYAVRRYVPVPTHTSSFIVCTWALHAIGVSLALPPTQWEIHVPEALNVAEGLIEGLSEVMLVGGNPYTGLFFLVAIVLSNWRHAILALLGTTIGISVALYHGDSNAYITLGLYGYNSALATIGLYLWRPSLIAPLLGAVVAVVITECFPRTGLPTLTAPFVAATWVVQAIGWIEGRVERPLRPKTPGG